MKLSRKKGKGLRVVTIDGNRKSRLNKTLTLISEKKRRQELATSGNAPLATPNTKITVKMNTSGNFRGLNPASRRSPEEMQKIRAMRKFYSKQMPVPQCNSCAYSSNCPSFRAGYECAFLPFLEAHQIDSMEDIMRYMEELLGASMRRTHQTMIMETLSGGSPSLETSEAIALAFGQLKDLHALKERTENAEVTLETDDKSIIGQLFGNMGSLMDSTSAALKNPIDVPTLIVRESDGGGGDAVRMDEEVRDAFTKMELAKEAERYKGKKGKPAIILQTQLAAD